jgi:hypothetical protein
MGCSISCSIANRIKLSETERLFIKKRVCEETLG